MNPEELEEHTNRAKRMKRMKPDNHQMEIVLRELSDIKSALNILSSQISQNSCICCRNKNPVSLGGPPRAPGSGWYKPSTYPL